jgi:hypothetical protein
MEKRKPKREIGATPERGFTECHENDNLLEAVRTQIQGLDLVKGAEAPEEKRRGSLESTLQVADKGHILTGLWCRLCFLVVNLIVPSGSDLLDHEWVQGPFHDLVKGHGCSLEGGGV